MSLSLADLITDEDAIIYNTVAASTLIFWDHCITLNEEVELVWRSKWSLVNLMFVVVRYMTLIVRIVELLFYTNVTGLIHPSHSRCVAYIRFEAVAGQIIVFCVEILLIMRVFAFYGRRKALLAALLTLFFCENVARMTILGLTMPKIHPVPNALPHNLHIGACVIKAVPSLFLNYWVPPLIFESVLFILVALRYLYTKYQAELESPHFLLVFIRDGAWAFALIFAVLTWSTLAFELTPIKGDIALTWLFSVLGFSGSRLVLNLRSAASDFTAPITGDDIELNFRKNSVMDSGTGRTKSLETGTDTKK